MAPDRGDSLIALRRLAPLAATAAAVWLLVALAPVLAPFALAAVLAYIANPLVARLARRGISRPIGSLLAVFLLAIAFVGIALIVAPLVIEQGVRIAARLPEFVRRLNDDLAPWLNQRFGLDLEFDLRHLNDFARSHAEGLQEIAGRLLGSLTRSGVAIAGLLASLILVPVVLFYLLVDWDPLLDKIEALLPRRYHARAVTIAGEIDAVLGQFLRGQLSVMLILALYYMLALAIAGLEFAVPVGLLTGLLIFIPYAGFGLGLVLALLTALMQGEGWMLILVVAAIYGVGQLLESFLLTPYLVGEKIGLHPVAVIFALMAFGQLFGFLGVLIALPASAALLVAIRHLHADYLASDLYRRP